MYTKKASDDQRPRIIILAVDISLVNSAMLAAPDRTGLFPISGGGRSRRWACHQNCNKCYQDVEDVGVGDEARPAISCADRINCGGARCVGNSSVDALDERGVTEDGA
jgi:hypothetical protein